MTIGNASDAVFAALDMGEGKDWFIDNEISCCAGEYLMIRVSENDKEKGYSFTATLA